jgi:acyl-CoA thioesterase
MTSRGHRPDRISPFAKLVGLRFPESDGPQCELQIEEKVLNVYGTVHGGAISTLADISMGYALFGHLHEDERLATVEMKINYVAAVSSGVLTAEAKLVNRTRNLAVLESRVECSGKLVAKAMGTFYISRKTSREGP